MHAHATPVRAVATQSRYVQAHVRTPKSAPQTCQNTQWVFEHPNPRVEQLFEGLIWLPGYTLFARRRPNFLRPSPQPPPPPQ